MREVRRAAGGRVSVVRISNEPGDEFCGGCGASLRVARAHAATMYREMSLDFWLAQAEAEIVELESRPP